LDLDSFSGAGQQHYDALVCGEVNVTVDSDGDGCPDDVEMVLVNGDKQANVLDVLWIAKAAFSLIACHHSLDMNRDGSCDILDVVLAARNSTLVEPHSACP
jgi:hypothetical protein